MLGGMRAARRELSGVRTEVVEPPVDRLVAALATRQHGVLSRAQLRELGLSQTGIARRIEQGRLLACTAASTPSVIAPSRDTVTGWPRCWPRGRALR